MIEQCLRWNHCFSRNSLKVSRFNSIGQIIGQTLDFSISSLSTQSIIICIIVVAVFQMAQLFLRLTPSEKKKKFFAKITLLSSFALTFGWCCYIYFDDINQRVRNHIDLEIENRSVCNRLYEMNTCFDAILTQGNLQLKDKCLEWQACGTNIEMIGNRSAIHSLIASEGFDGLVTALSYRSLFVIICLQLLAFVPTIFNRLVASFRILNLTSTVQKRIALSNDTIKKKK